MYNIPKKIAARLVQGIKNFQPILIAAQDRDVNEADTVTIVVDILSEVFGYDKYHEITKEFQIRGTYCDLATRIDGKINLLLEIKAIGIELKEHHVKQAVDYASNEGIDWVVLTNGVQWMVFKVQFTKPINADLVYHFNFLELNNKKKKDLELIYPLTQEGSKKSSLSIIYDQRQVMSRFSLGALILSEPMLNIFRRELRKIAGGINITVEEIEDVLRNDVIKREVLENDKLKESSRKIARNMTPKKTRKPKQKSSEDSKLSTELAEPNSSN